MNPQYLDPARFELLRIAARKRGLFVWIDQRARHIGQPFIWLKRGESVLAELWTDEDAYAWMAGVQR